MRNHGETTRPGPVTGARGRATRQMSVMHIFRAAAETGTARTDQDSIRNDPATRGAAAGDADDTAPDSATATAGSGLRSRRAARGATDEQELRRHLALDLESLIATVRLDAVLPLPADSRIARSVVNYGFADLSRASGTSRSRNAIAETIRQSLLSFEPRLVPGTLVVETDEDTDETSSTNRLTFRIAAELAADPADIPLDFIAEVDLGAGKLRTRRLRQR